MTLEPREQHFKMIFSIRPSNHLLVPFIGKIHISGGSDPLCFSLLPARPSTLRRFLLGPSIKKNTSSFIAFESALLRSSEIRVQDLRRCAAYTEADPCL